MDFEPENPLPEQEPNYGNLGRYGGSNLLIASGQFVGWAVLLTSIETAETWWLKVPLALIFCTLMQGVFTMMHEYFHGNAHSNGVLNYMIGVVGSTTFGTSATLHRINHWGHHTRNRTSAERGEFIHEGESAIGKVGLYYFATMGGLWLFGAIFPVLSLFIPYRTLERVKERGEFNTYLEAFKEFGAADWTRMRLEGVGLAVFWGGILYNEVWQWQTLLLAYAAFAYHWSVLQWIYHLRTPIDVVEGAYNLRLPAPIRLAWLNFNCNLTHHRRPDLPWQELYAATNQQETQPLWYRYLLMWLPPTRYPSDRSYLEKTYF